MGSWVLIVTSCGPPSKDHKRRQSIEGCVHYVRGAERVAVKARSINN